MTFQFDSWQAFWDMGGYGFFVWLAFSVTFLAVIALVVETLWAKKQLVQAVNAQIARKKRIQKSQQKKTDEAQPSASPSQLKQEVESQ